MLLLDVLNEAIEKAKAIMIEKNPEIDPKSAEADQLSKVCMFVIIETKQYFSRTLASVQWSSMTSRTAVSVTLSLSLRTQ